MRRRVPRGRKRGKRPEGGGTHLSKRGVKRSSAERRERRRETEWVQKTWEGKEGAGTGVSVGKVKKGRSKDIK